MKIPKYVQELMGRAEYNFTLPGKNPNAEVGYIVELVRSLVENESSYDTMWAALGSFED